MALEHRSLSYVPENGEFIHCPACGDRMERSGSEHISHSICDDCDRHVGYLHHEVSVSTIPQIIIRR